MLTDVRNAALPVTSITIRYTFGLIDPHLFGTFLINQIVGGGPVVIQGEQVGSLDKAGIHGGVDHGTDLVTVQKDMTIGSGPVGAFRIDDSAPLAC